MDWELYERYRATLVLIGVGFVSFLLLTFQRSSSVRHVKAALVWVTLPAERFLSRLGFSSPDPYGSTPPSIPSEIPSHPVNLLGLQGEQNRALRVYQDENVRLRELLALKGQRWPSAVAADVIGRDPQRWFQDILLDKGREDGLAVDDAVIVWSGKQEALVGRIVETGPHVSKVMLIEDSLSAVAAKVEGASEEDGVVEGTNSNDLYLHYLSRSSHIRIGDSVLTSGLGETFPEGILIGWVEDLGVDSRQLFLEARLRPSMIMRSLRRVLVLVKKG